MRISLEWLNDLIEIGNIEAEAIAEKLSRTGLEVEGVENYGSELSKLVIGEVVSCENHPDADKLHVCQVDIGTGEFLQIVCGAPNVRVGLKVITALHKARIANGEKIKRGKLRGVSSNGMLCSLEELGFPKNVIPPQFSNGIMELPACAPVGEDVVAYLQLDDPILDIDITPNRSDALSYRGLAYELSAIYEWPLKFSDSFHSEIANNEQATSLSISVSDEQLIPEYNGLIINDITVKDSPLKIQVRLMKAGIRPLNNIVDATNYIMLEYGQPLHAFDYDKLPNKSLHVRLAKPGEQLTTINHETYILGGEDLVITSGGEPIALAGVMGGLTTEVTQNTKKIALEAACFDPVHVRKTAQKHALRSESSMRNERGLDTSCILEAGKACATLMAAWGLGKVENNISRSSVLGNAPCEIHSNLNFINQHLGLSLSYEDLEGLIQRLGFKIIGQAEDFTVLVPKRRPDIQIPADLTEEVGRIYGYDNIPSRIPEVQGYQVARAHKEQFYQTIGWRMRALGFDEVVSYRLTSPEGQQRFEQFDRAAIPLAMPMSADRSVLKTNLLTGLVDIAHYNLARRQENIQIYEISRISYKDQADIHSEMTHLAGLWCGLEREKTWDAEKEVVDFFSIKGIIENLMSYCHLQGDFVYESDSHLKDMHPGRSAVLYLQNGENKINLGYLGQVHPNTSKYFDLPKNTFVFELDLDLIYQQAKSINLYEEVPKYPGSERDLALIVDEKVENQEIIAIIKDKGNQYLRSVKLFDFYQGEGIAEGKKSLAYQLSYLNLEGNLEDEMINENLKTISEALVSALDAKIR